MLNVNIVDTYSARALVRDFRTIYSKVGTSIFRSKEVGEHYRAELEKLKRYGLCRVVETRHQQVVDTSRCYRNDMTLVNTRNQDTVDEIENAVEGETYKAVKGRVIKGEFYTYQLTCNSISDLIDEIENQLFKAGKDLRMHFC